MIELDLDAEDWRCAGFWRVTDDDWRVFSAADRLEALIASAPPKRRVRRPSLESQLRQLWKAARAAGVPIAVTIEGDTVTATPAREKSPRQLAKIEPLASRRQTRRSAARCSKPGPSPSRKLCSEMPKPKKYWGVEANRNRHGRPRWYFRRPDKKAAPRIRLPDSYGSLEFEAAWRAAMAGQPCRSVRAAAKRAGPRAGRSRWLWREEAERCPDESPRDNPLGELGQ